MQIDIFPPHRLPRRGRVHAEQREPHLRPFFPESVDCIRHQPSGGRRQRPDPQIARLGIPQFRNLSLQEELLGKQALHRRQQRHGLGRRLQPAAAAVEQFQAHGFFQVAQALAGGWLGDAQQPSGLGHVTGAHDETEEFKLTKTSHADHRKP